MTWLRTPLGKVLRLEYGKALRADDRRTSGEFLVAGSNGPDGYHTKPLVHGPGIVVGRKGSAGKVAWYEKDFWPSIPLTTWCRKWKSSFDGPSICFSTCRWIALP